MDTYFNTNHHCVKCGRCVKACAKHEGFLGGGKHIGPRKLWDYVPCHHCPSDENHNKPCEVVCHYGAIEIERW